MLLNLENKKRLVIKIGSSLLVEKGELRQDWLRNFAKDVASLVEDGFEIIIVTSGSIALGRNNLERKKSKASLGERQAAAAIGQIQLMSFYNNFFKEFDLDVAQILLTAADCNSRERYINCKNTIDSLLENSIIPIINENDSVTIDQIKVGDNDRLAARTAQMSSADLMILFSDIDGLYDSNPKTNKDAKLIKEVFDITPEIEEMADTATSSVGTGGMITKIIAAQMLESSGCDSVVTSGIANGSLKKLISGEQNFTIFYSKEDSRNQRKTWLAGFFNLESGVIVNKRAVDFLRNKKVSLLPIGIIGVVGDFAKGEAIFIRDESGADIASGISHYSSVDVMKILKKKSHQVRDILGSDFTKEVVVHIDDLMVF